MDENITKQQTETTFIKCPIFKKNFSYIKFGDDGSQYGECTRCSFITFKSATSMHATNLVSCPFCQSTNCKKISGASKIGKVALFGVFAAGSVSKTWHCNNCGSNFG